MLNAFEQNSAGYVREAFLTVCVSRLREIVFSPVQTGPSILKAP